VDDLSIIFISIAGGVSLGLFIKFIINKVNFGIEGGNKNQLWTPMFLMIAVMLIAIMSW
jgi:DMSO reductase anchor subunit